MAQIRVGRRRYIGGKPCDPSYPEFKNIICLTPSSDWGSLGPYALKDEQGCLMENIWQFSKIYERVPASAQPYSRWNKRIIWKHPAEVHVVCVGNKKYITDAYYEWRKKGFFSPDPIRYPAGYSHRRKCLGALIGSDEEIKQANADGVLPLISYITARKQIYVPTYCTLVKQQPQFKQLQQMLYDQNTNLLIIEVDGPHQESLDYYKTQYGVNDDFIQDHTILVTRQNIEIMLHDDRHSFGHGYCLAMALLNKDTEWN